MVRVALPLFEESLSPRPASVGEEAGGTDVDQFLPVIKSTCNI